LPDGLSLLPVALIERKAGRGEAAMSSSSDRADTALLDLYFLSSKKRRRRSPRARVRRRFNNFNSFKSFPVAQTLAGWVIAAIKVMFYGVKGDVLWGQR
jgi:hypothetical protein